MVGGCGTGLTAAIQSTAFSCFIGPATGHGGVPFP